MIDALVFVIVGYYTDGSAAGGETIIAVFKTRVQADRFVELAQKLQPAKCLEVVPMSVEP